MVRKPKPQLDWDEPEDKPPCKKCGIVHPACNAHTNSRNGEACRVAPIAGGTVCRFHGGKVRKVALAAARRQAEREVMEEARVLGGKLNIRPDEALLEELQWTAGHVAWLRGKVQTMEEAELLRSVTRRVATETDSGTQRTVVEEARISVLYELYERERRHLVQVAEVALRAGIEERRVRLAESEGRQLANAIKRILDMMLDRLLAAGLEPQLGALWPQLISDTVPVVLRDLAGRQIEAVPND